MKIYWCLLGKLEHTVSIVTYIYFIIAANMCCVLSLTHYMQYLINSHNYTL